MTTLQKAGPSPAAAEKQLSGFIAKFDPESQRLIRSLRRAMRRRLPSANELVWDNYNFFVIGYSATERPSDSVLSLAAGASGVDYRIALTGALAVTARSPPARTAP